jgi:N-ethylmaleimide reductase
MGDSYGMGDSDPAATFGYAVRALDRRRVGYLTMLEPNRKELEKGVPIEHVAKTFRPMTSMPFIANTGFDKDKGMAAIASREVDAVAFGTLYIANPDLVARFEADAGFNNPDPSTFYGVGPKGYTDYPALPDRKPNVA